MKENVSTPSMKDIFSKLGLKHALTPELRSKPNLLECTDQTTDAIQIPRQDSKQQLHVVEEIVEHHHEETKQAQIKI